MLHRIFSDINTIYFYSSLCYIIKSGDKLYKRCLRRTCLTYNSDCLPRLYFKRNIRKYILFCFFFIFKPYIFKFDSTLFNAYILGRLISHINFFIYYLNDSCTRRKGTCHHKKYIGHHHK